MLVYFGWILSMYHFFYSQLTVSRCVWGRVQVLLEGWSVLFIERSAVASPTHAACLSFSSTNNHSKSTPVLVTQLNVGLVVGYWFSSQHCHTTPLHCTLHTVTQSHAVSSSSSSWPSAPEHLGAGSDPAKTSSGGSSVSDRPCASSGAAAELESWWKQVTRVACRLFSHHIQSTSCAFHPFVTDFWHHKYTEFWKVTTTCNDLSLIDRSWNLGFISVVVAFFLFFGVKTFDFIMFSDTYTNFLHFLFVNQIFK